MKVIRFLAAAAVAVGLLVPAAPAMAESPAIVGGSPATEVYPFLGSLQLDKNGDPNWHDCGVTLINPNFAETNAHCVSNEPSSGPDAAAAERHFGNWLSTSADPAVDYSDPSAYHIRFDSNDRLHGGIVRHVSKIILNPYWNWAVTLGPAGEVGDIALLQLDSPVTTLAPAVVQEADASKVAREVGWGYTDEAGEPADPTPTPEFLNQLDVPVSDSSACDGNGIGTGEICLGGQGGGICNGDSGSPALQTLSDAPEWRLIVGSVSRIAHDTCGDVGEGAVYTDVQYYVPWILSVLYPPAPQGTTGSAHKAGAE